MIQVKHLYLTHKKDLRPLLSDFSFALNPGDKTVIIGEEGNGKSTLLKWLVSPALVEDYVEAEGERITGGAKIGYLPQELDLYPNLTVEECLEYMGELSGIEKKECRQRMKYYLEKTSLTQHRKKKIRQLSGGMKRRVGLIQALLNEPEFLIVDEPTTGLDPEERIRIRNLLVDFSENRTILFSTHVVEDLAATCNQLAVMKKGEFLYSGSMQELLNAAKGHVWICMVRDEFQARELEKRYHVSAKQYVDGGLQMKLLCETQPDIPCTPCEITLEDAYIYVTNKK